MNPRAHHVPCCMCHVRLAPLTDRWETTGICTVCLSQRFGMRPPRPSLWQRLAAWLELQGWL